MKHLVLIIIAFCVKVHVFSQTMKASIGPGSSANKILIYIKPDAGISNGTISTLAFNVAVLASTNPAPNLTISQTILNGFNWTIGGSYVEEGYRHYAIGTSSSPSITISANVETPVLEISFSGGAGIANVYLMTLPDGGTTDGNALFYCSGAANSNGSDLYYTRSGPPATTVINGFSYPGGTDISYATIPNVVMGASSNTTDYFRSITSGNWSSPSTWESSPVADFSSGVQNPATLTPDNNANIISIRNGHTVTVTENVTTDQTLINAGGTLVVSSSTLTVINNGLTVQSNIAGNGRIGTSIGSINGDVIVERYINDAGKRSWRLLSGKSVSSSQTIFDSWQESGSVVANKGVWITSGATLLPGFDGTSNNGASILIHDQTIPSWTSIPVANTNNTLLSSRQGYMLFVRGDRSYTPANAPGYNTTVLKVKGALNQGNQPAIMVSSSGSGRTLLGNPYASAIDVDPIFLANPTLDQAMYVWDATLTGNFGVGGFRLVERNGGAYQQTPVVIGGGASPDANSRYIHSGQAFFLKASGSNANVVISESMKTGNLSVVNPIVNTPRDQQIFVNLMIVNSGNVESLADGLRVRFDGAYNANTSDDFEKMGNFAENISSYREGKKLIVEKRPMTVKNDTIFIRMTNLGVKDYRFQFGTLDFAQNNITAFLEDTWLNTKTHLSLDANISSLNFSITADSASANPDRFRIVFKTLNALPLTLVNIKAEQQNNFIAVEWKVSNQVGIEKYELEKSGDGLNFIRVNTQNMLGASGTDAIYKWLDLNPYTGDNFYRIRSISNSRDIKMSQVVKVTMAESQSSITVYPNPVFNKKVSLQLTNMTKGIYRIRLTNPLGQIIGNYSFFHAGGNSKQPLSLNNRLAVGTYRMEITGPSGKKTSMTLVIAD